MTRLTRREDQYPCRMAGYCPADEWIMRMGGDSSNSCDNCPFEKYINALAEYEDKEEKLIDDGK